MTAAEAGGLMSRSWQKETQLKEEIVTLKQVAVNAVICLSLFCYSDLKTKSVLKIHLYTVGVYAFHDYILGDPNSDAAYDPV